jgi:hypothetical protein
MLCYRNISRLCLSYRNYFAHQKPETDPSYICDGRVVTEEDH